MQFKDLVSLYFERSNAFETFWSVDISVIFAVLALCGNIKPARYKKFLAFVLSLSFLAFAVSNLGALRDANRARFATKRLIQDYKVEGSLTQETKDDILITMTPLSNYQVIPWHLVADALTIGCIWYMLMRKPTSP